MRIAAKHGMVEYTDGDWTIRTLDPQKPIQVNEEVCRQRVLEQSDQIDIGGYRLRFSRIEREQTSDTRRSTQSPPLSLIVHQGPTIPDPVLNAIAPQRFIIGHGDTALWQLPHPTVSRHHCAVQSIADRWEIEDLNSTNATKVNGTEVLRHMLRDRDVITFGRFEVLVSLRF
jgi:predicted component of type VI protein secretion system